MQSFSNKSRKFANSMNSYPNLKLKPGKEKSLMRKHPWVFSGALTNDIKQTPEGSIVNVTDINNRYLGTGYVQHGSIAVRIISFTQCEIDLNFWTNKLEKSFALRQYLQLGDNASTNCYRLMHGEGDDIPGLIIDIYNGIAVIQCHTDRKSTRLNSSHITISYAVFCLKKKKKKKQKKKKKKKKRKKNKNKKKKRKKQ